MATVFISYRESDSGTMTERLHESLARALGPTRVYKDVLAGAGNPAGNDVRERLRRYVALSTAFLVVIGKQWTETRDAQGKRLLENPADPVRLEIECALQRPALRVIPVLVHDAKMPPAFRLPLALRGLPHRQAVSVRNDPEFTQDVKRLIDQLDTGRGRRRRLALACVALLCLALGAVWYWIANPKERLSGGVGQWLYDSQVAIRVPDQIAGTIIGEKPYDVELEIQNRTSMHLFISEIKMTRKSRQASALLGMNEEFSFPFTYHLRDHLKPNETRKLTMAGSQFLPEWAEIAIAHDLSPQPSRFQVDLAPRLLKMPEPRRLPRGAVFRGMDGLDAYQSAQALALSWDKDASLVAAFPANNSISLEPESRLKILQVDSWVVNFLVPGKNKGYGVVVGADGPKGNTFEMKEREWEPVAAVAALVLSCGNQEALQRASDHDLLSMSGGDLRLRPVTADGRVTCAWFLPYHDANAAPVVIDAANGDRLVFDRVLRAGNYKRSPFPDGNR